jgi:hypothetical protein
MPTHILIQCCPLLGKLLLLPSPPHLQQETLLLLTSPRNLQQLRAVTAAAAETRSTVTR